ncbi:transmembrane secretion effector [Nonomuraea polychroma]|uniref:Transmembrane secretion effector n=1 Tax=Nonomuraea polychroma TaxID=46176 RepID=A0A438M890_9ACTN|nr:MFS transporter [Nonomuraea polychroma]RVX41917.1 transmembrane secretion effector [Nonomuraea polychroma]
MATFASLFRVREFRYLYPAYALSYLGDQLSSVAVAVLVFDRTGSAAVTAVAFAAAFLPSALGPVLGSFADRFPRRRLLIACDLARAVLVAALAIPGMPMGAAIALLYLAHLFTPPFTSARAALMPEVLSGEAYVIGNGLTNLTYQISQVAGFAIGGATVLLITPVGALLVNAATFAISAMLIWRGIRPRSALGSQGVHWSPIRGAVEGVRYVFADSWLRQCLLLVWLVPAFAFGVEAIAYPLARELGGGPSLAGMLMATIALGYATGATVLTRWTSPPVRDRILVPLALLPGLALLPLLAHPPTPVVLILLFCSGLGCSFSTPLNAMFVLRAAPAYRGRAMGVAIAGIAAGQGGGFLLSGWVSELGVTASATVGLCGIGAVAAAVCCGAAYSSASARSMSTDVASGEPSGT